MKRTVLFVALSRRRMMLPLFAALLAFIAAALVTFIASVAKVPVASDQTSIVKSFSVLCNWSYNDYDDPIVYPDKKGAAHRHDFFGNRTTKYNSTYTSLRNATTKSAFQNRRALHQSSGLDREIVLRTQTKGRGCHAPVPRGVLGLGPSR